MQRRFVYAHYLYSFTNTSQGGEENISNDITRALIKGLPRLFIKHQTDQNRISDVLLIPTLMNLDLYLEMRMITVSFFFWFSISFLIPHYIGVYQPMGRCHKAIRFTFLDQGSFLRNDSNPVFHGRNQLIEFK